MKLLKSELNSFITLTVVGSYLNVFHLQENGCIALLLVSLKINGSVQSMKEENSRENAATFSKLTAQVIILCYTIDVE